MSEGRTRRDTLTRAGLGESSMARCERCGAAGPLSCHHRVKEGQGGAWSMPNIVRLCGDGTTGCHGWAEENRDGVAEADGFALKSHADPVQVPIRHHMWGTVWLDDQGGYLFHAPEASSS